MAITPFHCSHCDGDFYRVTWLEGHGIVCISCAAEIQHAIKHGEGPFFALPAHPKERAVVWEDGNGNVRYPGKNDAPMPKRYAKRGFQHHELLTLRDIERFEKDKGVRSEVAWYDRGSGRGPEDD